MGGDCPRRSIPIRCAARGRFEPSVVYQFVPVPNSPATSCFISGAAQPGRARLAGRHEPSVGDHAAFCLDYLRLSAGRNGAAADIRIAAFDTEFDDDTQRAKVAETIRKLPNVDIWALFSIPIRKSFGRRGGIPLLITLGLGLLSLAAIDRISTKARDLPVTRRSVCAHHTGPGGDICKAQRSDRRYLHYTVGRPAWGQPSRAVPDVKFRRL